MAAGMSPSEVTRQWRGPEAEAQNPLTDGRMTKPDSVIELSRTREITPVTTNPGDLLNPNFKLPQATGTERLALADIRDMAAMYRQERLAQISLVE